MHPPRKGKTPARVESANFPVLIHFADVDAAEANAAPQAKRRPEGATSYLSRGARVGSSELFGAPNQCVLMCVLPQDVV